MATTPTTQDSVEAQAAVMKLMRAAVGDQTGDAESFGLANGGGIMGTNLTHAQLEYLGFSPRREYESRVPCGCPPHSQSDIGAHASVTNK
jgi:hypothetical protein